MIDIKDDFLPEEIIHDLEWVIMGQNFAWFLQNKWGGEEAEKINGYTKTDNYLQHHFWSKGWYSDRYNDVCRAWVDMYIRPTAIIRVKGNLYPKTEKIKSVLCFGTKSYLACVPFRNPLPKKPPAPIAIFDVNTLFSFVSISGSKL